MAERVMIVMATTRARAKLAGSRRLLLALAVCGLLTGCATNAADAEQAGGTQPSVLLASVVVTGGTFELSASGCTQVECTLVVRWSGISAAPQEATLDWRVSAKAVDQVQEDYWYGTGGIVTGAEKLTAYAIGEEYDAVTTNLQGVALAPALPALLVRQRAGFEHLKRRFYLFMVVHNRLTLAWSAAEGTGPYRSAVAVVAGNDGAEELVHFQGFAPRIGNPDTVQVTRLAWTPDQKTLRKEAASGLPVIRLDRGHASLGAASAVLASAADCVGGYWLLAAEHLDTDNKGATEIVALAATAELAKFEIARVQSCLPKASPQIARNRALH